MMSNPPSSLQQQQRLHRRQNSTPVASEAMKVHLPPSTIQRQNSHRRGQSHDLSRSPIRRQNYRTGSAVSISTNIGSTQQGQQILREAQQQRLARPGQQTHHIDLSISPQCGIFQHSSSSIPGSPYDMTMNAAMNGTHDMVTHSQQYNIPDVQFQIPDFGYDENEQHYFHQSNQHVGLFPETDRRMSHPDLRIYTGMRPITPTNQIQTAQFPLTPSATPFRGQFMNHARSLQTSPGYPSQEDGICSPRPVSMKKSKSLQEIVEHDEISSMSNAFDMAEMPVPQLYQNISEPTKHSQNTSHASSPLKTSTPAADYDEFKPLFGEIIERAPKLEERQVPVLASSRQSQSPTRTALSPRRMSISDLNLEPGINASIEETNVTLDDIAQFIEGPDENDNKWICKYDDCNKRFGRKENIKSHVQTHLGDRQFRCDHCRKCFVRGHDLKRHAKIHTGTKPYPCLCGNAFARHDALTRHRQRGMCIGAFEGVVKKEVKRGRPRKHRPEMDERVDKAGRTRRNQAGSDYQDSQNDMYASSNSTCSISSWGSPPTEIMDNLSINGGRPHSPLSYDDMGLFGMPAHNMHMNVHIHDSSSDQIALPPDMFSFTPPASPGYSTGNRTSPSYRELTPIELASIDDVSSAQTMSAIITEVPLPEMSSSLSSHTGSTTRLSLVANPMALQHSQQSLPGLSHSSSSPAADIAVFDFAEDPSAGLRMSTMSNLSMGMGLNMNMGMSMKSERERNDFDNFLDYGTMDMGADSFFANL